MAPLNKVYENLWWALAYNVIAFPLAAGVFYPFMLQPSDRRALDIGQLSLLTVNALLLKTAPA